MKVLGLSYMYHESAACVVKDGKIIAAAAEERFNRAKHSLDFPYHAINFCLQEAQLEVNELDAVVFYEKPFQKFERILKTYIATFPFSFRSFQQSIPLWLKYKLFVRQKIKEELNYRGKIYFVDHHYAHAASAFYPSPFEKAAILTTDGTGEWTTLACGRGEGNVITLDKEIRFPHSLGLLYSAITAFLGFRVNGGEGKVMALAAYGQPVYYEFFKKIVEIKEDGSFFMDMQYFSYHCDLVMTSRRFERIFGKPRIPESTITKRDYDMAATLQKITEEALITIARYLNRETGCRNLCMAGGVALNCVANHKILENTDFKDIFIQPAAGDDGGSIGSAIYVDMLLSGNSSRYLMKNAFLGPSYTKDEIRSFLNGNKIASLEYSSRRQLHSFIANELLNNKILGYFYGRMEIGPRALGARSIIANPMNPQMKDILNNKVKHRENFRPFAPAVLYEYKDEYFRLLADSPYMLLAAPIKEDKEHLIPAVIHVDGRARVQTVKKEDAPDFYDLIDEFRKTSGMPMVVNTSFNDKGEPIVCSPWDAYLCFINTQLDYLVLGDFVVVKEPEGQ